LNHSELFLKVKKLFLFVLFALIFVGLGIFVASGLKWSSSTQADPQTTATSQEVKPDSGKFFYSKEEFLAGPESPFVMVAEKVSPAVVNIRAEKVMKGGSFQELLPFDDFFRRFFGEEPERKPRTYRGQSLGSGFIIREDGYILTWFPAQTTYRLNCPTAPSIRLRWWGWIRIRTSRC
jgi:serine protease DegS